MKIWVDAQLPPTLANWLSSTFGLGDTLAIQRERFECGTTDGRSPLTIHMSTMA